VRRWRSLLSTVLTEGETFVHKEQQMNRIVNQIIIFPLLIAFLLVNAFTPAASAAVIDTQTLLAVETESPQDVLTAFLAREDVHDQMVALGVDPESAANRVAGLTDQELVELQSHIRELPAGSSALAVLGAVFLVLIVLELVGVTNIFSKL